MLAAASAAVTVLAWLMLVEQITKTTAEWIAIAFLSLIICGLFASVVVLLGMIYRVLKPKVR